MRRHYGVADGRYKLIHFYEKDVAQWELFDLKSDPSEMKSVYGTAEYMETTEPARSAAGNSSAGIGCTPNGPTSLHH